MHEMRPEHTKVYQATLKMYGKKLNGKQGLTGTIGGWWTDESINEYIKNAKKIGLTVEVVKNDE